MSLLRRFSPSREKASGDLRVVVGLGNPGPRYEKTRHNAGALVLQRLLDRSGGALKRHKTGTLTAEVRIAAERVVLARSTGFMNESGRPVAQLVRWYKVDPSALIVVHDELDIPFGEIRLKSGGGTAGHNGLTSLSSHLGTKNFARVRVGISRPPGRQDPADYVLQEFSNAQRRELDEVLERAADAVERIIEVGIERAMNEVNTRV